MRVLAWIAGGVAVLVACVAGAVLLFDWNDAKGMAEEFAGGLIGREVKIDSLDGDLGWTTEVRVRGISVANTDWAEGDHLGRVDELDFAIRLWPLVGGNIVLPHVDIKGADLDLQGDEKGRNNWTFAAVGEAAAKGVTPDDRSDFPKIGRLKIDGSKLRFRDAGKQLDLSGDIAYAQGKSTESDELRLTLKGKLGKDPLTIDFTGGNLDVLQDESTPYPLDISVVQGPVKISARGTVKDFDDLEELKLDVTASGPDLARVFPELHLPLPNTPPFRLAIDVHRKGGNWQLAKIDGTVGQSDISGFGTVDVGGDKPLIRGELQSRRLDFNDLGALIGLQTASAAAPPKKADGAARPAPSAAPGPAPNPTPAEAETPPSQSPAAADTAAPASAKRARGGLFPDVPLDEERLETANVDLKFTARSIHAENIPLTSAAAHVELEDSRLHIAGLDVGLADGRLRGDVVIDAREGVPQTTFDLSVANLDLKSFFRGTRFIEQMGGRFSGRAKIAGTGKTLAEVMATSNGAAELGIREGSLSGLLIEGAGLDVVEALSLYLGDDARVPIRCGRITLGVEDGLAHAKRVVVDTTDSTLVAQGRLNLATEEMYLQIEAREKDFSLIDLAAPVVIKGPMTDPGFAIGGIDPLPFFEMGDQKDVDCKVLMDGIDVTGR